MAKAQQRKEVQVVLQFCLRSYYLGGGCSIRVGFWYFIIYKDHISHSATNDLPKLAQFGSSTKLATT